MINLLIKKFVRNYEDIKNPIVRESYGKFSSILGIICNVLLCTSKILVGLIFNSVSITADGINNLSDAGSSVITLIGFKLASKPADKDHPFGHARIEYIAGLIVSFIILLLGVELIKTSFAKIISPEPLDFSIIMVIVLILSILVKLFMYFANINLSKRITSATIKATAKDSLNDVIATSAVLASVIISKLTNLQLDGYIGMLVAVFIIFSGIEILKEILNPLLGEPPSKDLVNTVVKKIMSYDGVINIHDLVIHNYGANKYFATVHVEVSYKEDILESHDMIDNIERDFLSDMGINLVVHLDPVVTDDEETNNIKKEVLAIIKSLGDDYSMHDFRIVKGSTHTNIIFDVVAPTECKIQSKELIYNISKEIKKLNETYYPIIVIDYNYNSTK
ncbi:MAG TPA: cation-efflux pump [Clostridiales bacterium]|nr:cation-efflux pump [Clostridiales bacterium]